MGINELDFLNARLTERKASLLLGAGFSVGAKNAGHKDILLGEGLSKQLYKHFYIDCPPAKFSREYCENIKLYEKDLKKICTILSSENRRELRDFYLTNIFSGCKPVGTQFQNKIKNYSWKKIFTLNIDDLVENIFANSNTPLCKWNHSQHGNQQEDSQTLIKLHGDVMDPEGGFVFDEDEYTSFTLENNCLLKEFATCFLSGDMVILGTEFQENDLSFILKLYELAGYNDNGNHYFFVVPNLKDVVLRNKINSNENFHWIKMNTNQFLEHITENVIEPENHRSVLKEHGTIFLDEIKHKQNYTSKIYSGDYAQYNDFFENWDIRYPGQQNLVEESIKSSDAYIITLFGKSYNGKTTIAKRFLMDYKNNGYVSLEIQNSNVINSLYTYLSDIGSNVKVAVLMENAAYQYEYIVSLVEKCASIVARFVIITTDSIDNHCSRNHFFNGLPKNIKWKEIEISEQINSEYAAKAFFTLCTKHRLNNYLKLLPPKSSPTISMNMYRIQFKMKAINDIIDVLYYSSDGQYFRDHYATWLKAHNNSQYIEYLYVLCTLNKLGIPYIPTACLASLIPEKAAHFSEEKLLRDFSEVIEEKDGYTKLLRGRIVAETLPVLPKSLVIEAIRQLVFYTLGLFHEGDNNEYFEMFQKALRVKRIREYTLLDRDQLIELFISLENKCSSISYYWIQYGLAAQLMKDFEGANNHFLYAQRIHPNSYQVAHALAKNHMEVGYNELEKGKASADDTFGHGCQEMIDIITSPDYSHAFNYSVHSYAYMLMKYYNKKRVLIPSEQCAQLNRYFIEIIQRPIDSRIKEIIISFYKYCERNEIIKYCNGLKDIWRIKPIATSHDEDYDN